MRKSELIAKYNHNHGKDGKFVSSGAGGGKGSGSKASVQGGGGARGGVPKKASTKKATRQSEIGASKPVPRITPGGHKLGPKQSDQYDKLTARGRAGYNNARKYGKTHKQAMEHATRRQGSKVAMKKAPATKAAGRPTHNVGDRVEFQGTNRNGKPATIRGQVKGIYANGDLKVQGGGNFVQIARVKPTKAKITQSASDAAARRSSGAKAAAQTRTIRAKRKKSGADRNVPYYGANRGYGSYYD